MPTSKNKSAAVIANPSEGMGKQSGKPRIASEFTLFAMTTVDGQIYF
ncbi:MAG: hypothetical protein H0X26_06340 [Alphaproteobacteria bacterium]|nr:hypothetical protein [Alphaproteobacteria bacterium]